MRRLYYKLKCFLGFHVWCILPTMRSILEGTFIERNEREIVCGRCGAKSKAIELQVAERLLNHEFSTF